MARKTSKPEPQALVVYYATEMYGPRKSIILCQDHRNQFFSFHPDAYGCGEWRTLGECEQCQKGGR